MGLKAVDFFCGVGGLTSGLLEAGIEVLLGIDNDPNVKEIYEINNEVPMFLGDIFVLQPDEISEYLPRNREKDKLLFAGCPPCQPFSQLNRNNEREDRFALSKFSEFVKHYKPDFVQIENVPGIIKQQVFKEFIQTLEELNYKYCYGVVNAKYFGVPQNRKRLVLIAAKHTEVQIPADTHGKGKKDFVTVKDAIGDYILFPPLNAGETHPIIPNHTCSAISEKNLERLKLTPKNGGSRNSWQSVENLSLECYKKVDGYQDVYGRMRWDSPAPTLTTKFNGITNGRFGHPEQNRAISLKEGAALQTFRYDYKFKGSIKTIAKCIGNAVPPKLAKVIGEYILSIV